MSLNHAQGGSARAGRFDLLFGVKRRLEPGFKILDHRGQGDAVHGTGDGLFDFAVWLRQHAAYVLRNGAGPVVAGMDAYDRGQPFGLQSGIDLEKRYLLRISAKLCPALPALHRDQSSFFQGAQDSANDHRIASGALG